MLSALREVIFSLLSVEGHDWRLNIAYQNQHEEIVSYLSHSPKVGDEISWRIAKASCADYLAILLSAIHHRFGEYIRLSIRYDSLQIGA